MPTHFEESLQRDIDRIRGKIGQMADLCERALRDCLEALRTRNRQLAYAVILRDRRVDDLEKEVDRLCLEFLVRQQPVAGPLRFAYSTIRMNLELERVGDYAESIARQAIKLIGLQVEAGMGRFAEIASLAIPMLRDSVKAFVTQDAELARRTMETEEKVDVLRHTINAELFQLRQEGKIPLEALTPMMTVARRFERVSDQAKNICQEVLYMCTGEYTRHAGQEAYRVLFIDDHHSCRGPMAEAVAQTFGLPQFIFNSAGVEPRPLDERMAGFLRGKGVESARKAAQRIDQVPHLEYYDVIVSLSPGAAKGLPAAPRKGILLDWAMADPSAAQGSEAEIAAAYERTYQDIHAHLHDLVEAILGDKIG